MTPKIVISLLAIFITGAISFIIIPIVKKISLKIKLLDYPNERKIHTIPVPNLGGIGIVISFYIGILLSFGLTEIVMSIILSSLFIVLAGILDDIFSINPKLKLLLQFIGALVFISFGHNYMIRFFNFNGKIVFLNKLSIVFTVLWLIGSSNAINLIDGLDGLAGGVSLISSFSLGILCLLIGNNKYAIVAFVLSASIIGFLKYNFYPANIFMGDTGSLFLGFILGELAILGALKGSTIVSFILPILILGIPLLDVFWSITRRLISKKPIMKADKNHLHHRLLKIGFTHKQAVLFIYCISAILGTTAILISGLKIYENIIIIFVVVILFVLFWKMGLLKKIKNNDKLFKLNNKINYDEK